MVSLVKQPNYRMSHDLCSHEHCLTSNTRKVFAWRFLTCTAYSPLKSHYRYQHTYLIHYNYKADLVLLALTLSILFECQEGCGCKERYSLGDF